MSAPLVISHGAHRGDKIGVIKLCEQKTEKARVLGWISGVGWANIVPRNSSLDRCPHVSTHVGIRTA